MNPDPTIFSSPISRRRWLGRMGVAFGMAAATRWGSAQTTPSEVGGLPGAAARDWAARYPDLKLINLAGNENPFGPSRRVSLAIMRAVSESCRYPFREEQVLKEMIAGKEGVVPEAIVLGNGCDEILSMAGAVYGAPGKEVVASEPTYLQLVEKAEHHGATAVWVPHDKGMRHDLAAIYAAINENTSIVYVCNPDTPSGTIKKASEMKDFCETVAGEGVPVFLDEVYLDLLDDFDAQTQVELVHRGLPVMIGRSFSKMHALAGHRIGYAVTTPEMARRLEAERMSSLNFLGVVAARESLLDDAFHRHSRRKIREGREGYEALLTSLDLAYTPSVCNFVFHYTGIPIREFQAKCKERGFFAGRPFPPYDDWCRISIGSQAEMNAFAPVLRDIIEEHRAARSA